MGIVYSAEDDLLQRTVALKFLPPELGSDAEANERFIHEAQAASALDHPNICTIHEIGRTDDGQLFICMAFYEGETLKKKIERGPFPVPEALDVVRQVAHGLVRAHERGIIHRDIKPANVLLTSDGTVKIVDFGLAKLSGRTAITREGIPLGTVYYMSPEQARGEPVDRRTDIWSLGVVLYEIVSGRRPFDGEYENVVIYRILNAVPEPLTALRTGVSMELERIVCKCLEKNPSDRYQHLDEFLVDIRHLEKAALLPTRVPAETVRPGKAFRRRVRGRSVLIVAAACALLLFGLELLVREPGRRGEASVRRKSIAVLPFTSITRTPEDEIFADGIHDDILTQLSKIRDMRVIGRTSMVQYRETRKRLREIGDELGAGFILEGSVRRSAGTIRITAQLIDAETEGHLWAEDYDRDFADVFAIQSEIARKIASSLKSVLSPLEKSSIETVPTQDERAYEYYLKGNYYWYNTTTPEGNKLAAEFYQKATEIDSSFAIAHACVAIVNSSLYRSNQDRTPARLRRAEEALARASNLGPELPEVHHARGLYFALMQNDPGAALREYHLALEKKPGDADVMFDCAYALVRQRKLKDALEWLTWGLDHDPRALFTGMHPEILNAVMRNWDEALRWGDLYISGRPSDPRGYYEKAFVLMDGFGDLGRARGALDDEARYGAAEIRGSRVWAWPLWRLECLARRFDRALACLGNDTSDAYALERGIALAFMGRNGEARRYFERARQAAERALEANAPSGELYDDLGRALAWTGRTGEAVTALGRAIDMTPPNTDQFLARERREETLAEVYTIAGDRKKAVAQLTLLLHKPSFLTRWKIRLDPLYDRLRDDPGIQSLLAEVP